MSEISQSLFPSLFSTGTGIPLFPLFPVSRSQISSRPARPSLHSFLHFLSLLGSSTQGHTAGAFTPASQPATTVHAFHSFKHVVFTLSEMPERLFAADQGCVGGPIGFMVSAAGRDEERDESCSAWFSSGRHTGLSGLFYISGKVVSVQRFSPTPLTEKSAHTLVKSFHFSSPKHLVGPRRQTNVNRNITWMSNALMTFASK